MNTVVRGSVAIIIFAKAPVPGFAKTRLAPALGEIGAARLAARMLEETVREAVAADIGPVELCCAPHVFDPAFESLRDRFGVTLSGQGEGDLGERMQRALRRALQQHARAILIGTDVPGRDAAHLRLAAAALRTHDAVFTPTADGGYALVGVAGAVPEVFSGVAWSTSQVMAQTRARVAALGVSCAELPLLHDVDEPDDLVHVPMGWLA